MNEDLRKQLASFDSLLDREFSSLVQHSLTSGEAWLALASAYESQSARYWPKAPRALPGGRSWPSDLKFALHHATLHSCGPFDDHPLLAPTTTPRAKDMDWAHRVLTLSDRYHSAVCLMHYTWAGLARVVFDAPNALRLTATPDFRFDVLDEHIHGLSQHTAIPQNIAEHLRDAVATSSRNCRLDGGTIVVADLDPAEAAVALVPDTDPRIPDSWVWNGLTGATTVKILAALRNNVLAHDLTVSLSLQRWGLPRTPLANLCYRTDAGKIQRHIADRTGCTSTEVAAVLDMLCYGAGTRRPDPALQPLAVCPGGQLAIPHNLVATSNIARNFLALAARVDPPSFDANSHVFSDSMVSELESTAVTGGLLAKSKVSIPNRPDLGDIDLIVADRPSRQILLCELKWTIETADPKETLTRMTTAAQAAQKVADRLQSVRSSPAWMYRLFALTAGDPLEWTLSGLVVYRSFSCPPRHGVPIVSDAIFQRMLRRRVSLRTLYRALVDGSYLPQEGLHYTTHRALIHLGKCSFEWDAMLVDCDRMDTLCEALPDP